ncbi:MAG: cation-transporting P-type ATPase [Gemmatimonadota bacterium]
MTGGGPDRTHATVAPRGAETRESGPTPWHRLAVEEALARLEAGPEGLSEREAAQRLERYGQNALSIHPPTSLGRILYEQVKSLVVLLLFAASVVALLVGDVLEAVAIGAVLAINVVIGFWVEWRARQEMHALSRVVVQEAVVVRDGREGHVDARNLVPGDLIVVEAGFAIPADARLVSAAELMVIEAPLTGESVPAEKSADPIAPPEGEEVPLAERRSMVYKGTLAATGAGRAMVVATGLATEIGRISELVQETASEDTPLERQLDSLGKRLIWIAVGVAALVAVLGVVRGHDPWLMVETALALAIAAVPEGLPLVATITLALGMRRMARRHALIRRLPAVETLGSATIVCTDKTGTLTAAEMTVTRVETAGGSVEVTGRGFAAEGEFRIGGRRVRPPEVPGLELAIRIGVLANRARWRGGARAPEFGGDPTEVALLVLGRKAGVSREELLEAHPEVGEIPFSAERRFMATFHRDSAGRVTAYVKGAPARLLEASAARMTADGPVPLDETGRRALLERNDELGSQGLRLLGLAIGELTEDAPLDESVLRDLTFVGYAGMMDPPAPGAQETIALLRQAGVRTVMLTGDQAVTAHAVARELGVLHPEDETLDGRDLMRLSEAELTDRVERVTAFSRVSPEDKLRIVRAYQTRGEIVAMLGDGVNDAPALKRADIGVAMGGRGTDVAKETAGLVLQDDRFETIGAAVQEGRVIFDNIRKFIFYLFSCNLSEVLVLFAAGLAGLPLPLLPLQILWLNLVTDVFPALALAVEPAEPDVMRRPPRDPAGAILSGGFGAVVGAFGLMLTAVTLGAFLWALYVWEVEGDHAVTIAFMTIAMTQLLHVFNARSPGPVVTSRRFFGNPWVWGAIGLTVVLQLLAVYLPPLSRVLRTHALGLEDWGLVLLASFVPLVVGQAWKWLAYRGAPSAAR